MEQERFSTITLLTDSDAEYCVFCKKETRYKRCDPIERRKCYVEGAGQLCDECYIEIYEKDTPHNIKLLQKK